LRKDGNLLAGQSKNLDPVRKWLFMTTRLHTRSGSLSVAIRFFLVRLQTASSMQTFSPKIPLFTIVVFGLAMSCNANAQSSPGAQAASSNLVTPHHAKGTFEVNLKPLPLASDADSKLGRMSSDKKWAGDLVGTSKGEMLSARTDTKGSAAYVAVEKVAGTLDGHTGTFVLQHSGTMNRGVPQLSVTIVPDSGTEGLTGIKGTLHIEDKDGKHFYELEYTLPQ
jgi:hypothetical protein